MTISPIFEICDCDELFNKAYYYALLIMSISSPAYAGELINNHFCPYGHLPLRKGKKIKLKNFFKIIPPLTKGRKGGVKKSISLN